MAIRAPSPPVVWHLCFPLLTKLEHYGVRSEALKWFESYFSHRQQYFCYNNVSSSLTRVDYGVPQGSVIGPVLFILLINDIVHSTSDAQFVLLADDTSLFLSGNCMNRLTHRTNIALTNVNKWLTNN